MNSSVRANYGFGEKAFMALALIYTKLFWRRARLIRLPVRIRGKKALYYGEGFTLGYSCRIEIHGELNRKKLVIGKNCIVGDYAHIAANHSMQIGDDVLMASRVYISDTSHGSYDGDGDSSPGSLPNERPIVYKEVVIGNRVWIGENVSILPGVTIGDGVIIGANSVVTKDIPTCTIAAGCPAKVIKKWNGKEWERV